MQGGIYNAALFGASQREARGKLEQMGGIKRPGPSGILASSPELMQAAMPRPMPPMPQPAMAPQPAMPPQPALPQVPMQTAMAPQPMAQPQAPRPMAPAPQQPVMMQEGGPVDITREPVASSGIDPLQIFKDTVNRMGEGVYKRFIGMFDSEEEAMAEAEKKRDNIYAAMDTEDESKVGDAVVREAGLEPTDENKQEFARTVLGIDTDDIGEIDDAIFNTLTADVSLSGQKLQQAVLLGLQNYKQTASARAAAKSGGSGMSPLEPFPDAVRDLAGKIMTATGEDPAVAIQQARDALAPYYTGQAGPTTTTQTTETATVTIEQHKSANDAAKQAGQKTYTLGGQEFQVQ